MVWPSQVLVLLVMMAMMMLLVNRDKKLLASVPTASATGEGKTDSHVRNTIARAE